MSRALVLLGLSWLILAGQNSLATNDSTVVTPEGIGKHLSGLLINRGNIKNSPLAININRLSPDEDFSRFEDSPAKFILEMLYGYQILLPRSWYKLLLQADSLGIDCKTEYLKTCFIQTHQEQFSLTPVLTASSKYYAFTFNVLTWDGKYYILKVDNKLKEYAELEELEESLFEQEKELTDFEADDMFNSTVPTDSSGMEAYSYNQSYTVPEIEDVHIPSAQPFVDKLILAIEQLKDYGSDNIFLTADKLSEHPELEPVYKENVEKKWEELITLLKRKKSFSIKNSSLQLANFPYSYHVMISCRIEFESKSYTLSCTATLIDEKWKLIDISPLFEDLPFRF